MPSPTKKRAATEPTVPTDTKKPRVAAVKTSEVEDEDEEEPMQITTTLHQKFAVYPKQLRNVIEEHYNDEVYDILHSVKTGVPIKRNATYHIHRGVRWDHGKNIYRMAQKEVFPNAIMANIEALEQFLRKTPSKKSEFDKALEVKLANPDYTQLHSVPPGHVGWGFDMFGCISLRLTTVEDNKLKHAYIFVERRAVGTKVEDDDECQIVEGPDAPKE